MQTLIRWDMASALMFYFWQPKVPQEIPIETQRIPKDPTKEPEQISKDAKKGSKVDYQSVQLDTH